MLDVAGYLRRLGLPGRPEPSVEYLFAIHRAHVERIAYNTIDIHLGRRTNVDPRDAAGRIVTTGRGGYCFHLNGALGRLLVELGFDVRQHRGAVRSPRRDERPLDPFANHLALTVHGVATAANPEGAWFVDAGLGDALHEPMPLREGGHRQGPFEYGLTGSADLPGGWQFVHDPAGSFATMDFEAKQAGPRAFRTGHAHLSTSPQSPFVQLVLAQRRDGAGADKLVGCTLNRIDAAGTTSQEMTTRQEWLAALADVFGLTLDDTTEKERERLWQRAWESQMAWRRHQELDRERGWVDA
jgi:N-hydroxyarylamine O-acetyltransferase